MTTRREEREREAQPPRGQRARTSRESTRRITPRGAAGAAGRQKKVAAEPGGEEVREAEVVRAPPREGEAWRDLMFDLLAPPVAPRRFALDIDVRETPDAWVIEAEVPGLAPEDVAVTVEGDLLTIEGEKRWREVHEEETVHACECGAGRFVRSFRLPEAAAEDAVEATCEQGLLTVRVAKPRRAEPRRVEVRGSAAGERPVEGPGPAARGVSPGAEAEQIDAGGVD